MYSANPTEHSPRYTILIILSMVLLAVMAVWGINAYYTRDVGTDITCPKGEIKQVIEDSNGVKKGTCVKNSNLHFGNDKETNSPNPSGSSTSLNPIPVPS